RQTGLRIGSFGRQGRPQPSLLQTAVSRSADLLDDLHDFLDGYPVRAYSPNWFYRAVKLVRRRPLVPLTVLAALLTWGGFRVWQDMQAQLRAENLLNLAGYDFLEAQNADRMLRRDYRMTAIPRLADSAAGERVRADMNRRKIRMTDNYTAALELLARLSPRVARREPRAVEMARTIFRNRLRNELLSRRGDTVRETLEEMRTRWPELFGAAVNSDPTLRRIAAAIDSGNGRLELESDSDNWTVRLRRIGADSDHPEQTFDLTPGERIELELPAGNYHLEFAREEDIPIGAPVRVHLALTTRFCFEPPEQIESGFVYVPANEEMDAAGCTYLSGAFQISRTEVTVGEYLAFWNTLAPDEKERCRAILGGGAAAMPLWDDDGRINPPFSADQPVTGITGAAAKRYCRYLSRQLNRRVRLPREWEWRRAARGTDRRQFPWGDEYRGGRALLADSPRRAEFPHGAPPGSFPGDLSPCGVFDLAGNVREFALPSASETSLVLVMGGSYQLPPTCAAIDFSQLRLWSDRGDDIGFRCVIEE
ncbi:MAG: SUMF1/EgtB/PvdO family nonheme iron enzyme, partial [Lentisphaeria bacterium]|nr:SUMF1/EgtB/PvdO family nonheme iron enzyme [Lentisphaeria bacterium]